MCIQTIGSCSMLTKTATNMNSNPDLLTRVTNSEGVRKYEREHLVTWNMHFNHMTKHFAARCFHQLISLAIDVRVARSMVFDWTVVFFWQKVRLTI